MLELPSYLNSSLTGSLLLAQETEKASAHMSVGMKMLFIAGIVIAAFALSWALATALKMKEIQGRLRGVMLALFVGATPFLYLLYQGRPLSEAFNYGIDLAGGTNMVFQVYTEEDSDKQITKEVMDQMVSAVIRRLNPSGTEEITVRKVGSDRIEVIIPGKDRELVEAKKKLISRLGSLEFGILANTRDHAALAKNAEALPSDQDFYRVGNQIKAAWRDPGRNPGEDGGFEFKKVSWNPQTDVTREVERYGKTYRQFLVLVDPPDRRITGENLSGVMPSRDENGQPAVSFRLDAEGARNMRRLTSQNLPSADGQFERRLAILLDDTVHQAPGIKETLSSSILVSGLKNQAEVRELVSVLNAGALKVPIKPDPISEYSISPLLGADVRAKGLFSIEFAAVVVFGFMLLYYLRSGVIADLCLLLNVVLVAGSMSIFSATLTLPGLAGLVLTIGMAVDANVLIFERIREEKQRGSSQRMAIQNGFNKALSTIIDANVTTLITAVILYIIGSDQVRGFAVALFIGIVMSVFSALIFGKLLFDIGEKKKLLGKLGMFSIVGNTNINFLSARKLCAAISFAAIVGGMAVFGMRGVDNLDIDFTGGTMVTFELEEPAPIGQVKDILEKEKQFGGITLERLTGEGETGDVGKRYRMRTKQRDADRKTIELGQSADQGDEDAVARLEELAKEAELDPEDYDTWAELAEALEPTIKVLVAKAFEGETIQPRIVTVEYGDLKPIPSAKTETNQDSKDKDTTAGTPDIPFADGHTVNLKFSDEISTTTAEMYFRNELVTVQQGNQQKYSEPGELFNVKGTAGSGLDAGERESKKYSEIQLSVSPTVTAADLETILKRMQEHMAENPLFEEVNSFDSAVAKDMQQDAVMAILASLVAIVFYIWLRFDKVTFGFAAVAALVHDVLVVLGMVAVASYLSGSSVGTALGFYDFKINLPMVAAFLTIVGYSLNDTIVVFDRIREVRGKNPAMTTSMVNLSLNQTLSRTLLTSLTTLVVVLILYVFGGEGIHGFAFCLVLGVLVGTYSSVYVASPVLLWLINRPGSEIGMATAKAEEEEKKKREKQATASVSV